MQARSRGPLRRIGDDRSRVAESVHSLDVDVGVLLEVPPGANVCGYIAWPERGLPSVVDVDAIRRGQRQLVPVERGELPATADHVRA